MYGEEWDTIQVAGPRHCFDGLNGRGNEKSKVHIKAKLPATENESLAKQQNHDSCTAATEVVRSLQVAVRTRVALPPNVHCAEVIPHIHQ
jgi:hypothetical protein